MFFRDDYLNELATDVSPWINRGEKEMPMKKDFRLFRVLVIVLCCLFFLTACNDDDDDDDVLRMYGTTLALKEPAPLCCSVRRRGRKGT